MTFAEDKTGLLYGCILSVLLPEIHLCFKTADDSNFKNRIIIKVTHNNASQCASLS